MQWIKRNLYLVVGGVVALGLLGFAGFYLFTKVRQDQAITEELNTATTRLETLARRDPYPNPENITAAKEEGVRLQGFLSEVEAHFLPPRIPENLNNMTFRSFLDNTRARLLADAQLAGVEVPTNYWFTFSALSGTMDFKSATLQPLATQLADIQSICQVLFDAKVNSLAWLKRASVDSSDTSLTGSQDYLTAKAVTNTYSVVMPYEVAFQGFSSELAAVLDGLARLPHCLIVTNVVAEQAANATTPTTDESGQMADLSSRYGRPVGMDPMQAMRDRYGGMGGRYGGRYGGRGGMMNPMPVIPQPVQRPASRGPATILDEKPLRFVLSITAVNLKSTGK